MLATNAIYTATGTLSKAHDPSFPILITSPTKINTKPESVPRMLAQVEMT
jgi:hypothetical protein